VAFLANRNFLVNAILLGAYLVRLRERAVYARGTGRPTYHARMWSWSTSKIRPRTLRSLRRRVTIVWQNN